MQCGWSESGVERTGSNQTNERVRKRHRGKVAFHYSFDRSRRTKPKSEEYVGPIIRDGVSADTTQLSQHQRRARRGVCRTQRLSKVESGVAQ